MPRVDQTVVSERSSVPAELQAARGASADCQRLRCGATLLALTVVLSSCAATPTGQKAAGPVDIEEASEILVKALSESLSGLDIKKLAITGISGSSRRQMELAGWLEDQIGGGLLGALSGIQLVERDRLDAVLKEQELGISGSLDTTTTAKIGMLLGADAVIVGTIREVETNDLSVSLSVIKVRTAEVLAQPSVTIDGSSLIPESGGFLGTVPPPPLAASPILGQHTVGSVRLEVTDISLTPDRKRATVNMRLVNLTEGVILLGTKSGSFGHPLASLADDKGGSYLSFGDYRGSLVGVTSKSKKSSFTRLSPGPTPIYMLFKPNQGHMILGSRFTMTLTLLEWTPNEPVLYQFGFEDLYPD